MTREPHASPARRLAFAPTLAFSAAALAAASAGPAVAQAPAGAPAAVAPAQAAAWPADAAGLSALATRLANAWMSAAAAKDTAALEAQMAPCFQRVGFDGTRDRAAELDAIKAMQVKDPRVSDVIATRCGDALVVTCQVAAAESGPAGALDASPSCRLGVWVQDGGAWKLAAWATLHMPASRPAPAAPRGAANEAMDKEGAAMLQRYLDAQRAKDLKPFDDMMDAGMQVVNFRGQKAKDDLVKGASRVKTDPATIADARTTRCGELTVMTCSLAMTQHIGFTTLPGDPAPFLAVFRGTGDAAKVVATANTNKPK